MLRFKSCFQLYSLDLSFFFKPPISPKLPHHRNFSKSLQLYELDTRLFCDIKNISFVSLIFTQTSFVASAFAAAALYGNLTFGRNFLVLSFACWCLIWPRFLFIFAVISCLLRRFVVLARGKTLKSVVLVPRERFTIAFTE